MISVKNCLPLSKQKKGSKDKRKYDVFASNGHNSQFKELEPVRKKKTCSIMFNALENIYILTRFSG